MKPTTFKEQNVVVAENQPEYLSLPSLALNTKEGHVIHCWKLSFLERLYLLVTGRLWMCTLTFNQPLQPLLPTVYKKDLI